MTIPDFHVEDVEAMLANLQTAGVRTVRLLYPDVHGVARGKDIPLAEFHRIAADGIAFCAAVMTTDLRHTPVVGGEQGYRDLVARPDLGTLRVSSWQPGVALCIADLHALDGPPLGVCLRGALRRVVSAYDELGLSPVAGPELEFFLLERDTSGVLKRYVDELSRVYTVGYVSDPRGIVLEMLHACAELGLGAFAANHEYMNSQYEINVSHSPAVDAADRAFLLKAAVKDIAAREGLLATFMGKPFNDQGGSGFHFHLSIEADGENAFAAGAELSTLARRVAAGILEHATGLMALLAPTVNAYKRIVPDSLAPTRANWGHDNRTAFIRVPKERGAATRLEIRVGDGTANAHLALAALLAAGLDGIRRELEPPEPVSGDSYTLPGDAAGAPLPRDLSFALDALEADETLRGALGGELIGAFAALKRFEVERFSRWVTDWELDEYANHL
jgi:glutamine synthetase